MRKKTRLAAVVLGLLPGALGWGCNTEPDGAGAANPSAASAAAISDKGTGTDQKGRGALAISRNDALGFEATYSLGQQAARARVQYTPTTTLYEITTSLGTTIVRTGTAFGPGQPPAHAADPRTVDDVVRLSPTDREYPVISGLLRSLEDAGATSTPSRAQAGSTLYAAAYFAARSLGLVSTTTPPQDRGAARPARPRTWPYPGYYDKADMPAELRGAAPIRENGNGGITCCGPYVCRDADWNPGIICDDWCAAGDACNAWGWGGCGTADFCWQPWGCDGWCNNCPHSNSSTVRSSDPYGYNNGTCSPSGGGGPAANFDNWGALFFPGCGGEYGAGCDDGW